MTTLEQNCLKLLVNYVIGNEDLAQAHINDETTEEADVFKAALVLQAAFLD